MRHSKFDSFMQEALAEANVAFNRGEVPVGCVIVDWRTNKIISSSHNQMQAMKNPLMHAEILAINEACKKLVSKNLSGCDMYVTLEPCSMCASAISYSRLRRIYYGASDEKQGAVESGVRFFTTKSCFHRSEIYPDLSKEDCKALMKNFFVRLRQNNIY